VSSRFAGWGRIGAVLVGTALVLIGCAAAPPWPAGLDASRVRFDADPAPPELVIEGPASKVGGAMRGAAWGGGIGVLVGLALEGGCSYVCGVATALGAIAGVTSGVITGALASESEAQVDAKRALLIRQPLGP
jgi:hypothetical protein